MKISAILAASENNVIGSENDLPWRLSNDLQWFKKQTLHKPTIMGRKTFESLPGLLPNRTAIILTRDKNYSSEKALVAYTVEEALELAKKDALQKEQDEIMVIGGGEIYRLFEPLTDRFYLTRVHTEIQGDTHFFDLKDTDWKCVFQEKHPASENNQFDHTFHIFDRVKQK